jgi:hypothetical protein
MATLTNIRIGTDITAKLTLKDSGVAVNWMSVTIMKIAFMADAQKTMDGKSTAATNSYDSTILDVSYPAAQQFFLGQHSLVLVADYLGKVCTYDIPAFSFVEHSILVNSTLLAAEASDGNISLAIEVTGLDTSILDKIVTDCIDAASDCNSTNIEVTKAEEARQAEFDVLAHSDCTLEKRVENLEVLLKNIITGNIQIQKLEVKDLEVSGNNNLIKSGETAPSLPPDRIQIYIDTVHNKVYYSNDIQSVSSWGLV